MDIGEACHGGGGLAGYRHTVRYFDRGFLVYGFIFFYDSIGFAAYQQGTVRLQNETSVFTAIDRGDTVHDFCGNRLVEPYLRPVRH